jgi:hypothetical protein
MKRPMIAARMTKLKSGYYKVQCGHACSAPLGEARPPQTGTGVRVMDLDVSGPPPGTDLRQNWILAAPRNRRVSVADGFSRHVDDDGQLIHTIIAPKPKRDAFGRPVVDARGRPVVDVRARKPAPPEWANLAAIAAGTARYRDYGTSAVLPAVVECWRCQRLSRVVVPGADLK